MDKQKTKKVAVDVNKEQQKTLVNDIVIGSSEIGHKRITPVMIKKKPPYKSVLIVIYIFIYCM